MGTKVITEDVAHLIIAQVVFFLVPSIRVLPFLYFPVPVVTSLLKHSQRLTHWMLNLRGASFLFKLTLSPTCFVATVTQLLDEGNSSESI